MKEHPTASESTRLTDDDPASERLARAQRIVDAALELKAEKPVAMDVREVSSFADTFVILSGRSDRQVRSIADHISEVMKRSGERAIGIEGLAEAHWILMDYGDVIVHVFDPETREHYDLERLWSDAPNLPIESDEPSEAVSRPPG